jgi:predicted alpha/beta superfamily hydrolase
MSDNLQLHEAFASQYVQPRHVEVWLPPSYHRKATQRFGVLYMHDGQNLFRPEDAFIGVDWGIMPAMEQLIAQRAIPETIVVGIWNTGKRYQEYLPQKPYGTPFGQAAFSQLDQRFTPPILSDAYLQFIVTELKPFIDSHYRTRSSRAQTVIMGSSMGGLISLYALCEYPEIFGGAGCISTHWPAVSNVIRPYLQAALPPPR